MDAMIEIRESVINIIKRYQNAFDFIVKFIVGIVIYSSINNIGYAGANFDFMASGFMGIMFVVFMGVLFAILPMNANYVLMILATTIQFSSQLEIAVVVFVGLLAMFLFYGHFSKKEGTLVIATLMAFYFNMPYMIPIVAGMYFGVTAIIPIAIGVFIWSYSHLIMDLISDASVGITLETLSMEDLDDVLDAFTQLYQSISSGGEQIQNAIVITIAMFMSFIFIYIVSRLNIDYSREIAIGLGTVLNIFLFVFVSMFSNLDFSMVGIIFFAILSGCFMYLFSFFDKALDYQKAERVEFQDEDFLYQVKVIPKRKTTKAKTTNTREQRQRGSTTESRETREAIRRRLDNNEE